jgi:hypothetical protein
MYDGWLLYFKKAHVEFFSRLNSFVLFSDYTTTFANAL